MDSASSVGYTTIYLSHACKHGESLSLSLNTMLHNAAKTSKLSWFLYHFPWCNHHGLPSDAQEDGLSSRAGPLHMLSLPPLCHIHSPSSSKSHNLKCLKYRQARHLVSFWSAFLVPFIIWNYLFICCFLYCRLLGNKGLWLLAWNWILGASPGVLNCKVRANQVWAWLFNINKHLVGFGHLYLCCYDSSLMSLSFYVLTLWKASTRFKI